MKGFTTSWASSGWPSICMKPRLYGSALPSPALMQSLAFWEQVTLHSFKILWWMGVEAETPQAFKGSEISPRHIQAIISHSRGKEQVPCLFWFCENYIVDNQREAWLKVLCITNPVSLFILSQFENWDRCNPWNSHLNRHGLLRHSVVFLFNS